MTTTQKVFIFAKKLDGLVLGLEIVKSKKTKVPHPQLAKRITMECYKRGLLLIAPIGFYGNVLRVAPPLVLTIAQAKTGLDIMEEVFKKLG